MTIHFDAAALFESDLQKRPLEPPMATALGPPIGTRSKIMFSTEEPAVTAGVWECEPGRSRWEFLERGEFVHIHSGRMTVQRDGEDPVVLAAGDSATFPVGWTGTWDVHDLLRKVFVVFRTS